MAELVSLSAASLCCLERHSPHLLLVISTCYFVLYECYLILSIRSIAYGDWQNKKTRLVTFLNITITQFCRVGLLIIVYPKQARRCWLQGHPVVQGCIPRQQNSWGSESALLWQRQSSTLTLAVSVWSAAMYLVHPLIFAHG